MSTRHKLPPELTQGLEPIPLGLLRPDYKEVFAQGVAEREAEIERRLHILREWYHVPDGPNCWRALCLAMARERFPGFREKTGRKPPKWTMGVHWMLAGEMLRTLHDGAATQEEAAQRLAKRAPWLSFLASGRWRGKAAPHDRAAWENLLAQYTRMSEVNRRTGEAAYLGSHATDRMDEWDKLVRNFLEHPDGS